jgi:hypothetical protein
VDTGSREENASKQESGSWFSTTPALPGGFLHRDLLKRGVKTFGREQPFAPLPTLPGEP